MLEQRTLLQAGKERQFSQAHVAEAVHACSFHKQSNILMS
jgi:hypothetical protein